MTTTPASGKFVPVPTSDTLPYWRAAWEGRLSLPVCAACGPFAYPRGWCPSCGQPVSAWRDMSGRARLVSYVINHRPADGFEDETPYVVALVELAEGPRLLTNLVGVPADPAAIDLDMPLMVRFERRGDVGIPVFGPAEAT